MPHSAEYFTQFGKVHKVRLSRNKKTGRSKHYAFLEFSTPEVAKIVVEAMDGYFFFGQKLQCRVMRKSEVHPELFKGANRVFKNIPWLKIERERHNKAVDSEDPAVVAKQKKKSARRHRNRMEKIKQAGIEYDFENPLLEASPPVEGTTTELSKNSKNKKKKKKRPTEGTDDLDDKSSAKKRKKTTKQATHASQGVVVDVAKAAGVEHGTSGPVPGSGNGNDSKNAIERGRPSKKGVKIAPSKGEEAARNPPTESQATASGPSPRRTRTRTRAMAQETAEAPTAAGKKKRPAKLEEDVSLSAKPSRTKRRTVEAANAQDNVPSRSKRTMAKKA